MEQMYTQYLGADHTHFTSRRKCVGKERLKLHKLLLNLIQQFEHKRPDANSLKAQCGIFAGIYWHGTKQKIHLCVFQLDKAAKHK